MADEQDDSQKTEEPSRKRLQDAMDNGQVITSREINSFFMLFAFTLVMGWLAPGLFYIAQSTLFAFIEHPEGFEMDGQSILILMTRITEQAGMILFVPFLVFLCGFFG